MLDPHPVSRASLEDILSHPWLQKPAQKHCGRQRHLTRQSGRGYLAETSSASHHHHSSSSFDVHTSKTATGHKAVLRKNSSGYSTASSDLHSLPSPDTLTHTPPHTSTHFLKWNQTGRFLKNYFRHCLLPFVSFFKPFISLFSRSATIVRDQQNNKTDFLTIEIWCANRYIIIVARAVVGDCRVLYLYILWLFQ